MVAANGSDFCCDVACSTRLEHSCEIDVHFAPYRDCDSFFVVYGDSFYVDHHRLSPNSNARIATFVAKPRVDCDYPARSPRLMIDLHLLLAVVAAVVVVVAADLLLQPCLLYHCCRPVSLFPIHRVPLWSPLRPGHYEPVYS